MTDNQKPFTNECGNSFEAKGLLTNEGRKKAEQRKKKLKAPSKTCNFGPAKHTAGGRVSGCSRLPPCFHS